MIWWVEFHVQIWKETNFKNSMLKHLIIQQYAQIFLLWRPILHYCKIKSISMSSFFFFFLLPFTQVALVGMQMLCINTALGLDLGSKGCFAFGWKQLDKAAWKACTQEVGNYPFSISFFFHTPKPLLSAGIQLVVCNYRGMKYYKTNMQPSVDRWVSMIRCDYIVGIEAS